MLGIDTTPIKKYKKIFNGFKSISEIYTDMREEYLKIKSRDERDKLKYKLNDTISDSDRLAGLTLVLTLANSILKDIIGSLSLSIVKGFYDPKQLMEDAVKTKINEQSGTVIVIATFVFFAFVSYSVVTVINNYKLCKLYLLVIEDVEKNRDIYTSDNKRQFRYKILLLIYKRYYGQAPCLSIKKMERQFIKHRSEFKAEILRLENEKLIQETKENQMILTSEGIKYIETIFEIDKYLRNENKVLEATKLLEEDNFILKD